MLEVVGEQEHLLGGDVLMNPLFGPDGLRNRVEDERRIAKGRESHPKDAVAIVGETLFARTACELEREPGLPRTTRPCHRQEARRREFTIRLDQFVIPPEKARSRCRQVRISDRLERRELFIGELEEGDRMIEVLKTVRAEWDEQEPIPDEFRGRGRDNDLPTVPRRCDAGGMMNIGAYITLLREERRSGVHAHPQPYRPRGEPLRDRLSSFDCPPRVRER